MPFENQPTESSNHRMSWVADELNDLSTKMNCTLHDELTENGTDISEIVTENEATPDIQNIDPSICGENQVTDESCVLQEILINTSANTDTLLDLPSFVEEVTGIDTELPTSSLDWDFTVSNMFKIPSPPARKKASKVTSHHLLTADEMFEHKMKEDGIFVVKMFCLLYLCFNTPPFSYVPFVHLKIKLLVATKAKL